MPIPSGGRVRFKRQKNKDGTRTRLTFNRRGKVVETKKVRVKRRA